MGGSWRAIVFSCLALVAAGCNNDGRRQLSTNDTIATTTSITSATSTSTTSTTLSPTTGAPSTTSPTTPPATTAPPTSTTAASPQPTVATTTTVAIGPGQAAVTVFNDYPASMDVRINDAFVRAPGQARTGPIAVTLGWEGTENAVFEIDRTGDASCGRGTANDAFVDHLPRYELHIEPDGTVGCGTGHEGFRAYTEPGHKPI